jgi:hypothetical protein
LADFDRETIKGGPASRPQPDFNPGRAEARPGEPKVSDSRGAMPALPNGDSAVRRGPRRTSDSDRSLTPPRGLPRAQSLSSAKTEEPESALAGTRNSTATVRKAEPSPISSRDLIDRRKKTNSTPLPKWLWPWGVAGMFGLALIMLLIWLILSLRESGTPVPPPSPKPSRGLSLFEPASSGLVSLRFDSDSSSRDFFSDDRWL